MKTFKFEIITPQKVVVTEQVTHVRAPGIAGYFGVLAGHAPFLTALKIGEIKVNTDKLEQFYATSGGIIEVLPQGITILAETAEKADEIEVERAKWAMQRARKRLMAKARDVDLERARLALLRALNRIRVAGKI